MNKEITNRLKKHKFLNKYVEHYIKTEGTAEKEHYLPYLVIWFRKMFEACGYDDGDVPTLCGWDDYTAVDFLTWGHNSRWNNVFDSWLGANVEESLSVAFDTMDESEQSDFDIDVEKLIKEENNQK